MRTHGAFGDKTRLRPPLALSVVLAAILSFGATAANTGGQVAPVINSPLSASGTVNQPFSYTIWATTGAISYGATDLPDGLTLNGNTISGTPTEPCVDFAVTLSAENAGGAGYARLLITIDTGAPVITGPLEVYWDTWFYGGGNQTGGFSVAVTNEPTSITATGMPDWLTLTCDSTGCFISGQAPAPFIGTINVQITAGNDVGADTETLVIDCFPSNMYAQTFAGEWAPICVYTTEGVDAGESEFVVYFDGAWGNFFTIPISVEVSAAIPDSFSVDADHLTINVENGYGAAGVHISFATASLPAGLHELGTITFSNDDTGDFITVPVRAYVTALGASEDALNLACPVGGNIVAAFDLTTEPFQAPGQINFAVTTDPAASWLTASPTTGYVGYPDQYRLPITVACDASGLAAGTYQSTISVADAESPDDSVTITVCLTVTPADTSIALSSSVNPAQPNQAVTFTAVVTAPGTRMPTGTVTFLDDGEPLDTEILVNGAAQFTTAALALGDHDITAVYSGDSSFLDSASDALTQTIALVPPSITSPLFANAAYGAIFSYTITASGSAPITFGAGGLPAWLDISGATLSGIPDACGMVSVNITASNDAGGDSRTLWITVTNNAPVVSGGTVTGTAGQQFAYQIMATNNPTSYGAGSLPPDLTCNPVTGVVAGLPLTAGTYSVPLSAGNGFGTGTATLVVAINPVIPEVPVVSGGTANGVSGQPFNYTITATNSPTSFGAGGLPPGLYCDLVTGQINGTPLAAGRFNVQLSAANSTGTGMATLLIVIAANPPGISSASPSIGPVAGGTGVNITGTNFATGASVTFGNAPAAAVMVMSGATIFCTAPAFYSGTNPIYPSYTVPVTVTNPDGQSATLPGGFTYYTGNPPPVISSVSPPIGPVAGGTGVSINGMNFAVGATVTFGNAPAGGTMFMGGNSIYCATPAFNASGTNPIYPSYTVPVTVTNPDGQSATLPGGFTYYTGNPPPVISIVSPSSGPVAGGTGVNITGMNFAVGATVTFGNAPAGGTMYMGGNSIFCTTPAFNPSGTNPIYPSYTVPVTVTNPDGQTATLPGGFTYYTGNLPPPVINIVFPSSGPVAGGTGVTITGMNFAAGASVTFGNGPASGTMVISGTTIMCTTPAFNASGTNPIYPSYTVPVTVTNPDGQIGTLPGGFTYNAGGTLPAVVSVSPSTGPVAGGTGVTITGMNFAAGASVTFGNGPASGTMVMSGTTIICTTPAFNASGTNPIYPSYTVPVTVTNPGGQMGTLPGGFTYNAGGTLPAVVSVIPSTGPVTGGTGVTITGMNFAAGASVTFGSGPAIGTMVMNGTTIICTTPPFNASGTNPIYPSYTVPVTVTNPDGQMGTLLGGFTYGTAPAVVSVIPSTGPVAGGTGVTITGMNFAAGASVTFGNGPASGTMVMSDTTIICTTPAFNASGTNPIYPSYTVPVTVTNPDGQMGTLFGCFTYGTPPAVVSVIPSAGPVAGGTSVTITGMNFAAGASVTFGNGPASGTMVMSDTTIICTTPAFNASGTNPIYPSYTVPVTVTNPDGQMGTLFGCFTYGTPPAVVSVIPSAGPVAGGTSVTITGMNFAAGASVTFGNGPASGTMVMSDTTIICTTPAFNASGTNPIYPSYTVPVTVTNPGGQMGALPGGFTYYQSPAYLGLTWAAGTAGANGGLNEGDTTPVGWALGAVGAGAIRHTDSSGLPGDQAVTLIVRNTGNVAEQFAVTVSGSSPSNWQLGNTSIPSTPGAWYGAASGGIFSAGLATSDAGANTVYTSLYGAALVFSPPGGVPPNGTRQFYLLFQAPASAGGVGVPQSIMFTVTGSAQ